LVRARLRNGYNSITKREHSPYCSRDYSGRPPRRWDCAENLRIPFGKSATLRYSITPPLRGKGLEDEDDDEDENEAHHENVQ
jgi:hypothetical protein